MHSQWGDKQRSVHLYPSQAMIGNAVRVLSPGCGWQAGRRPPLSKVDSGAGRVARSHPRILRRRVVGRGAGVCPLACLQSLWDSGRPR